MKPPPFVYPLACARCGSTNVPYVMSMFNQDMICMTCKDREIQHPKYREAQDAEAAECAKGNYNFEGVGLPEDLAPRPDATPQS